jgi:hypothetical protein
MIELMTIMNFFLSGETALDCALPMLQYKMRQRMEELAVSQMAE